MSALLCTSLAYGRVDLFKPKLEWLHSKMGGSPAEYVRELTVARAAKDLYGFVYRFNLPADLAVLLLGVGKALKTRGSLEDLYLAHSGHDLQATLRGFTAELRDVPMKEIRKALGRERGLHHLLPSPENSGAAKRLNLYLRWMVRGPDEVDFGIWKRVPPSKLLIPLDTHIARIAQHLGLTGRKDLSWRTAEEITASLRLLDPEDPVRYDFALCHYGMSGLCPLKPKPSHCGSCALLGSCGTGTRLLRRVRRT